MDGDLWRMPFEEFNRLTVRAFEDHRQRYEATAPVFYRVLDNLQLQLLYAPVEVPDGEDYTVFEKKIPTSNWERLNDFGAGFMLEFQDFLVDLAWSALLLAAPATMLPRPRNSVSFAVSTTDDKFHLAGQVSRTFRVQGDADLEYVLLAESACPPLSAEIVAKATQLDPILDRIGRVPELLAALHTLQNTTVSTLYPAEQLTQTVMALESLLLPEVKSGLGATFSRRLSHLLAIDPPHRDRLRSIAALLYDVRSVGLHGGVPHLPEEAGVAIRDAYGSQLLAAAILSIATRPEPLDVVRASLDNDSASFVAVGSAIPLTEPPGKRRYERLLRATPEVSISLLTGSGIASLAAEKDMFLSWSPLVGLGLKEEFQLGELGSPLVLGLTGPEVLSLEDKDIRRDFISPLNMVQDTVAALAISDLCYGSEFSGQTRGPSELLRQRDLAVVALRLAGFLQFHDPELLGSFLYEGNMRYRRATVLRQTILRRLGVASEQYIGPTDKTRTSPLWALLSQYDREVRHPDVDNVLVLFRRACDHDFLPHTARASLMFSALESMLGRSRPYKEKVQLETLVSYLAGADTPHAVWFEQHGRAFRNSVAHGHWSLDATGQQPLDHMVSILQAVVPPFVRCWLELGAQSPERPGRVFIQRVVQEATKGGI